MGETSERSLAITAGKFLSAWLMLQNRAQVYVSLIIQTAGKTAKKEYLL